MNNVLIEHFQAGHLVETRSIHNTWTTYGQEYLCRLMAIQGLGGSPSGDVFQETARIRYMGFGIGSTTSDGYSFSPPLSTSYPAGSDPYATNGRTYNCRVPKQPVIRTLERPIRRSGGSAPYASAPGTDVWLFGPPDFQTYYRDMTSVTYTLSIDCTSGDAIYSPFTLIPLTEAGLYAATMAVSTSAPFSPLVAYVNFDTLQLTSTSLVNFYWTVRLAS